MIRQKRFTKLLDSSTNEGVCTQVRLLYNPRTDHIGIGSVFLKSYGYHGTSTNRDTAQFLGIYVAERVLSMVFKNVQIMPPGNPGYDFICGKGKKIDVKSACYCKCEKASWKLSIKYNTTPDYFLCLVFDNRQDLNPLHVWIIPGHVLNRFSGVSISESTLDKWSKYEQSLDKVLVCCNTMKEVI